MVKRVVRSTKVPMAELWSPIWTLNDDRTTNGLLREHRIAGDDGS